MIFREPAFNRIKKIPNGRVDERMECDNGRAKIFQVLNIQEDWHRSPGCSVKRGGGGGEVLSLWSLYLNIDLKYIHFRSKISMIKIQVTSINGSHFFHLKLLACKIEINVPPFPRDISIEKCVPPALGP